MQFRGTLPFRTTRPLSLVAAAGLSLTALLGVTAHLVPAPGMSPLSLTISDYAVSNNGWPMNLAILLLGITSLAVPLALRAARVAVGWLVETLLLVWCLGLVASALVPTDPIGVVELSTRGYVHRYVSVAAFVALPVATLLAVRRLAVDVRWRTAVRRLRVLAVTSVLGLAALYYVAFPGGRVMMGLVERILVVTELVLLAVLVGQLRRVAVAEAPPRSPRPAVEHGGVRRAARSVRGSTAGPRTRPGSRSSGRGRVAALEGQSRVGVLGDPAEYVVERQERLPRLLGAGLGEPIHDQPFEIRHPGPLPDLVGETDQEFLDAHRRVVPAGVGTGEPGELLADPVREQEVVSGGLVPAARSGQFGRVFDLADVVGGGPEQHRDVVHGQPGIPSGEPVEQLGGDVVHGAQVGGEPGWGVAGQQEFGGGRGERPECRLALVGEGPVQRAGGHGGQR
ncbi:DUF998 domain-containing protein [Plantactinospora sonchi]|uniref:DUF998 domain-containing protein n=1 Tax=Plantactinospora sonchi TaxID=1544735 RepID=A0ABU7RWJ5_9ACTN